MCPGMVMTTVVVLEMLLYARRKAKGALQETGSGTASRHFPSLGGLSLFLRGSGMQPYMLACY